MAQIKPAQEWTIEEVISRCPQAAAVFTRLGMACVGCPEDSGTRLCHADP